MLDITATDDAGGTLSPSAAQAAIAAVEGDPAHNTKATATISVSDPTKATNNIAPQKLGEIKGRGNFTWSLSKKPYQIKFPSSTKVLGMDSAKTWILLANATDGSLMRNKLAYDYAAAIGLSYSPDSRWVDLRINGTCYGNYLLAEKAEVKKNRVDLSDPQAVIAELDNNYGTAEDYYFRSATTGTIFTLKDAKSDVPDKAVEPLPAATQAGWDDMKAALNKLDSALHTTNPDWNAISQLIDVDSFVKYYFVYEVTENPELVASSVYFYKNGPTDKIHAGPVWDFDSALFNYDKSENLGADPVSDYAKNMATLRAPYRSTPSNPWYQDIFRNQQFVDRANDLWLNGVGAAANALPSKIDGYLAQTTSSAALNFTLPRNRILGGPTLLIPGEGKTYASTYAGEVSYLKSRVASRVNFLNSEYGVVPTVSNRGYVQGKGWTQTNLSGQIVGTTGQQLRLEAFSLAVTNAVGQSGGIQASSHVQNIGWSSWGSTSTIGSTGQALRLEAVKLRLTGNLANLYDISYRAHVANIGWQPWVTNGAQAGTTGQSLRIEAIQVRLLLKPGVNPTPSPTPTTTPTPTSTPTPTPTPSSTPTPTPTPTPTQSAASAEYSAQVQNLGWLATVKDGATAGTTGQSLRLEALRLAIKSSTGGGINWRGQVQDIGWQNWTTGNQIGTTGQGKRLESFQIKLTGDLATKFSVQYRAHVQTIGWQNWVSDGATAGTVGQSLRIEAVQIRLVPKQ
nr:CotH kinase family protein [Actinomycetota bacterium]